MKARKAEGAGGRTVNMEVSMLARAMGRKWSILWPKVKRNEEPTDTGRALSPEEEARLLKELEEARSPGLATFVKALLLTCMRCGELTGMRWAVADHAQWFTGRFGEPLPEHFLFPAGECWPNAPTQRSKRFKSAWGNLRKKANV